MPPKITDNIEIHAEYINSTYYLVPYPEEGQQFDEQQPVKSYSTPILRNELKIDVFQNSGIYRPYHGALHSSRVGIFTGIFANLYRYYGHKEALDLTDEDLKLITIAGLFIDAKRKHDTAPEQWNCDSALECYDYLIARGVPQKKAKWLAEAIANKDQDKTFHELDCDSRAWKTKDIAPSTPKNIAQILIHDADVAQMLRARDIIDARHFDFYKLFAKNDPKALRDLAYMICESRALHAYEGDNRYRPNIPCKKFYETQDCFQKIIDNLHNTALDLSYLRTLYSKNHLLSQDELKSIKLTRSLPLGADPEMTQKLDDGLIFGRALEPDRFNEDQKQKGRQATNLAVEIKKNTRTGEKPSNSGRSLSPFGRRGAAPPFGDCGFLVNVDTTRVLS